MRTTFSILRIALAALAIGGVLILLAVIGYRLVLQPQVTITAPVGSIIHVTDMQNSSKVAGITASSTQAAIALGTGTYQITVTNGGTSQAFYLKTTWLKRVSLRFAPPKQLTAAQLTRQVAYNAVGDASSLTYLNTSTQTIEQLSRGAKATLGNSGTSDARVMKVISNNRAIVLMDNKLYVLHDGHLNALRTDGFPDSISSLVVGTNPSQESFAVLANNALYWYQSQASAPQKIAELNKQADQLAVGGDQIIAYSTRMPNARQDIRYAYTSTYAVDPLLISAISGSQRAISDGPIVDASISPDGQYATIEKRGAPHTGIVRLSDGVTVQQVENADTLTPTWVSNTKYVYGKGSSVWALDINSLNSVTLATLPSNQTITSITYNAAKQLYLVTTYPSEQEAAIYQLQ